MTQVLTTSQRVGNTLLRGYKSLYQFLQKEQLQFNSSPIVLLTSSQQPSKTTTTTTTTTSLHNKNQPNDATRQTEFLLMQQMGFRTVMVGSSTAMLTSDNNTSSSSSFAYPTMDDIEHTMSVAQRIGSTTIAAVGSEAVMHHAKAVYHSSCNNQIDDLLLIPTTYEACLAASYSHALLYDPKEETIVLHPSSPIVLPSTTSNQRPSTTITIPPINHFSSCKQQQQDEAILAAVAIILDHIYHNPIILESSSPTNANNGSNDDDSLIQLLNQIFASELPLGESSGNVHHHDAIIDLLLFVGSQLLSFGLGSYTSSPPRSIPVAVVASLLPNTFPQYSSMSIMASLVPMLHERIVHQRHKRGDKLSALHQQQQDQVLKLLSSSLLFERLVPPTILTNDTMQALLSRIQTNRLVWNCHDVPDNELHHVIKNLLLVA